MYFLALAADYDGTIAAEGRVDPQTIEALKRFKATDRRLVLVTGRRLDDLKSIFAETDLFDRIVAENGAVLYDPATRQEATLAPAPSAAFVEALRRRGVAPLSVGRAIVSTWEPNEQMVLDAIQELGLELQIIFNKGAVMVLPTGVNKATGLDAALAELELSPHNAVGVGDAENDQAFLRLCGCSAAVANALPMVTEAADIALASERGSGVEELIGMICADDAALVPQRNHISIGVDDATGEPVRLAPHSGGVLVAGSSGIGKSTFAIALTEQMAAEKFQFCVFDPEGDYEDLNHAVPFGSIEAPPEIETALKLIQKIGANVVVDAQALDLTERPSFFAALLGRLSIARLRTGWPQWLLIDEAHHLFPLGRAAVGVPHEDISSAILVTVHPEAVAVEVLNLLDVVIALGPSAANVLQSYCAAIGIETPHYSGRAPAEEILVWRRSSATGPRLVRPERPLHAHRRHKRKYAEGDVGEERSFYFRGPDGALNLRAQNLTTFLQIADGVDDRTWEHHLRNGDYSKWLVETVKDEELAREVADIGSATTLDARQTRSLVREAVSRRYATSRVVGC